MDDAAHPKTWRAWFIALCGVSAVLALVEAVLTLTLWGSTGISAVPTGAPFVERVLSTRPHSPVHVGDLIDLRTLSPSERWDWQFAPAGQVESYELTVRRNGRTVSVTVVAGPPLYFGVPFTSLASWPWWLGTLGEFWMIAFASLIAWRRPGSREARILALLLVLTALAPVLYTWVSAPFAMRVLLFAAGQMCAAIGTSLLAIYAMVFKPASRIRALLAWSTYALCSVSLVQAYLLVFAIWTADIDPNNALLNGTISQIFVGVLQFVLPLLCGAVAIAETQGAERARLSWTMASLGSFCLLSAVSVLVQTFAPEHLSVAFMLGNSGLFIAPLGLTYGLLNRKLLDIGFALNRAAIFTGVSVVVVGVFVLVEWTFGEWLRDSSHTANVAVSGSLALVLGLSVRFVHGRVEHVVDNVFFRKRHEDEAALRAFAHEAGYINNPETLVARTITTIERHTDATNAQVAIDDGVGCYGNASEDDPAIVTLRAWYKPLDLHGVETALRGDIAFPMVARGRLVGALVLGPKRSGETYAPDESDALMQVAQSVGTSLAVLDRKAVVTDDTLEEIRALRSDLRALSQRLDVHHHNNAVAGKTPGL